MTRSIRTALVAAIAVLSMVAHALPQRARDPAGPNPRGTAAVLGKVVTDEAQPVPIRRARVTIRSNDGPGSWTTTTDDDGRFAVPDLPAGRFSIEAAKPAWIAGRYGATRPGRPGTSVVVAEGARIADVEIRMSRGAVITGVVSDRRGQPVPGVTVTAMQFVRHQFTGERVLSLPPGYPSSTTDDRGIYRCFGLPPGEYVVAATLRSGPPTALIDLRRVTADEVQRALSGDATSAGAPGQGGSLVSYAPVYFPGTADVSRADSSRLSAGEERTGVDIVLDPVPTARVEAIPGLPHDGDRASLQVLLVPAQDAPIRLASGRGRSTPEGSVVFSGVAPGSYKLVARAAVAGAAPAAVPAGGRGRGAAAAFTLFGSADLVVDGRDLTVPLDIQPGVTVSGRLRFVDDPARTPADGAIGLALLPRGITLLGATNTKVDGSGRFAFIGVPAGQHRLVLTSGAKVPEALRSAMSDGRDILDSWLDVREGVNVGDLEIAFSERLSELAGRLETAAGAAAPDYFIVVFAADRSFWTPQSRRIRTVRPDTDGRFTMRGLPAGDYLVAALTDVEDGEWYETALLEALVPAAVKVTVREGERTTQDLRIR
jgi:hypothetical protein